MVRNFSHRGPFASERNERRVVSPQKCNGCTFHQDAVRFARPTLPSQSPHSPCCSRPLASVSSPPGLQGGVDGFSLANAEAGDGVERRK